jgi:mannose-6-phosphate isomerase-like protein (cupin superfamily)
MPKVNLSEKLSLFSDYWAPRAIAQLNDYEVKLVKVHGDFVWHSHAETDELFLVLRGKLRIDLRDEAIELDAGELYVVPRGVEHKPFAAEECEMLLVEPRGVVNTGDAGGALTAVPRVL